MMTYREVDHVDRSLEQTTSGGGSVLRPPWDVPDVGRIAIVKDSSGGVGAMTPSGPTS